MSRRLRQPGPQAWLALVALAVVASVLVGAASFALFASDWRNVTQRIANACFLAVESVLRDPWAWVTGHPWTAVALSVLAGSLAWALGRLGLSLVSSWRVARRFSPYEAGRLPDLDRALGLAPEIDRTRLRVAASARPAAFTAGLLCPWICLSRGLVEQMSDTELASVLRHEHAHARVGDPARLAAARVLADFLWFLPISQLVAERVSAEAELRADEAAVGAGSDPLELASAIVRTARGGMAMPALSPSLRGLGLVERRVSRLLGHDQGAAAPLPWGRGAASALVLLTLLGILLGPALGRPGGGIPGLAAAATGVRSMLGPSMRDCPLIHCLGYGGS